MLCSRVSVFRGLKPNYETKVVEIEDHYKLVPRNVKVKRNSGLFIHRTRRTSTKNEICLHLTESLVTLILLFLPFVFTHRPFPDLPLRRERVETCYGCVQIPSRPQTGEWGRFSTVVSFLQSKCPLRKFTPV